MILVEDVYYSYEGIHAALRGVSLQIDDGEAVAIMGNNGAGKTTLIKHFNGLLRPDQGRVFIDGVDARKRSVAELSRTVGLVWQNPDHQLFLDTVKKELLFGLKNLGYSEEASLDRCDRTLKRLGIEHLADRSPFSLSGGERKRVALACVLALGPRILVLDEPTIGQDGSQKNNLMKILREMNKEGRTVIVVTHDVEFVADNFKRTIVMSAGRIVADGRTSSVLSIDSVIQQCSLIHPQVTQTARLLSTTFPEISPRITGVAELEDTIMRLIGGRRDVVS